MDSLKKSIINWCRLHPDDPECKSIMEGISESAAKKKVELKKWKLIATALEQIAEGREES